MASAENEEGSAGEPEGTAIDQTTQQPIRPQFVARRQSSFSDTFSKITSSNPFNRRRTTTLSHSSTSSAAFNYPSRIPTPSGISRSGSFFSTLSTFASKTSSANGGSEVTEQPTITKPPRKISDRLAQTPFLNYQHQRISTTSLCNKQKRESAVQIEQRGLMAPLHPPLPRSSTMGNLGQGQSAQNSPKSPSFMRPTSSSAARRGSLSTPKQRNTPMPSIPSSKTPSSASRIPMTSFRGSTQNVSDRRPSPLTGLIPHSMTPATERHQPLIEREPLTTMDYAATNRGSRMLSGTRSRTPSALDPSRRSNGLPSPKERRMGWYQGKKTGRRLASSRRPSHHGNDGASELMALIVDSPGVNRTLKVSVNTGDHNTAQIDTPLSAHNNDGIHTPPHHFENNHVEETRELPKLAAMGGDESPDPAEAPCALGDMSNPRLIHTALHPLEWTGRFTALSDRFRTSALPSSPSPSHSPNPTPPFTVSSDTLTNSFHEPMHDEAQRISRIWTHLHSLCTTDEARASLALFRVRMEEREKKMVDAVKGAKIKEKQGFFQALMAKKK